MECRIRGELDHARWVRVGKRKVVSPDNVPEMVSKLEWIMGFEVRMRLFNGGNIAVRCNGIG